MHEFTIEMRPEFTHLALKGLVSNYCTIAGLCGKVVAQKKKSPAVNSDHDDAWHVETYTAGYNRICWCQV